MGGVMLMEMLQFACIVVIAMRFLPTIAISFYEHLRKLQFFFLSVLSFFTLVMQAFS